MTREWYVYILQCSDASYYTGISSDPMARLAEHNEGGEHHAYTFPRRPVRLVWVEGFPERQAALDREHQIKGWSRVKKAALIRGDWERVHTIVSDERRRRETSRGT